MVLLYVTCLPIALVVFVIHTIFYIICDSMSKIVLFTLLTIRALYPVIHNNWLPIQHMVYWTGQYQTSIYKATTRARKQKQNKKRGNNNPKHVPENDRRRAL